MAKSKKQIDELKAHFFMSVSNGNVCTLYDDDDDKIILAASFASAMLEDKYLYDIISAAFLTLLDEKGKTDVLAPLKKKYSSKKSNKLPKKTAKAVK